MTVREEEEEETTTSRVYSSLDVRQPGGGWSWTLWRFASSGEEGEVAAGNRIEREGEKGGEPLRFIFSFLQFCRGERGGEGERDGWREEKDMVLFIQRLARIITTI